jgi:hypothetical protein
VIQSLVPAPHAAAGTKVYQILGTGAAYAISMKIVMEIDGLHACWRRRLDCWARSLESMASGDNHPRAVVKRLRQHSEHRGLPRTVPLDHCLYNRGSEGGARNINTKGWIKRSVIFPSRRPR